MSYPKKEIITDWGEVRFVEMTSEEYEKMLKAYIKKIDFFLNSKYRKEKEYGRYLERWFSEEICDGAPFSLKYKWHRLPMTFNQYIWS